MKLITSILTNNPCYKTGRKFTVKGLMLHSVGVPQPKASAFINSWNKPSYGRSCVHAFIDGNTGEIFQTLPWDHRAWHCGGSGNDTHVGVEMCEPASIKYTGGATFTCSNQEDAKAVVKRTYEAAVELFAYLCKQFDLNPLTRGVVIGHKEGCSMGIASNHADPEHLWKQLGLKYTMEGFRKDVYTSMGKCSPATEKPVIQAHNSSQRVVYKVQVGAFALKGNATKLQTKLKEKTFETYLVQEGKYWKVQVGAFSSKANAEAMVTKLKKAGFDALIITKN